MNPLRGEASIRVGGAELLLRPSFAALVAAEGELGSLFALVERAAAGEMRIAEIVALFWHCLAEREDVSREMLGEAVVAQGLGGVTPALTVLLRQILHGQ
ncbi:MAG: gene transfer agent family protein [Sphingomonadaceae bacterium]